jgi:hypothetical protein
MSITAEMAPSPVKTPIPQAAAVEGRRPVLAIVLISVSVLATVAWAVTMVWLATALLDQL